MSLRLILLVAIIILNAFFASAEVALISVRRSRLTQLAEEGSASARAALGLLANPGRLLSATQVGVTLASLGLGWAGEDTVYRMLLALFEPIIHLTPHTVPLLHGVAFTLAFLTISFGHVVLGRWFRKISHSRRRTEWRFSWRPRCWYFSGSPRRLCS